MNIEVVGNFLVNTDTGEILDPVYELVNTIVSTDDKRYYTITARNPYACREPAELKEFMKHTTDMRGVKVTSALVEWKKQNDFQVKTLKEKGFMSLSQYKVLEQIIGCLVYKNIVLCSKEELCKALGIEPKNLLSKLKTVSQWVKNDTDVKKGFVKLIISPMLGYKGPYNKQHTAYNSFYTIDKEVQQLTLYEPFVGPMQPYKEPKLSKSSLSYLANLSAKLEKEWKNKDKIQRIGTEFFVSAEEITSVMPDFVTEELPEYDYSEMNIEYV